MNTDKHGWNDNGFHPCSSVAILCFSALRSPQRQPGKLCGKDRAYGPARDDADIGPERIGEEVRRAGVSRGKIRLKDFNGKADERSQDDRGQCRTPDFVSGQAGAEAETEGYEPDDILEGGVPITPGHVEFFPERLEEDLIRKSVR